MEKVFADPPKLGKSHVLYALITIELTLLYCNTHHVGITIAHLICSVFSLFPN